MPTLILTPRFTDDAQSLWRAAVARGWRVERLVTWRVPDHVASIAEPVLFMEGLFGPVLAKVFGLDLREPPADWLPTLPYDYRKREVSLTTLAAARKITTPTFIKPPNDKTFAATVCVGADLPENYDAAMPILTAEIVTWEKEFRCFILDRTVQTTSIYLRRGELQRDRGFPASADEIAEAESFVAEVLCDESVDLPRAAVVDVGVIEGRGWAVVEQNAAWASGIYGCDPDRVLDVLACAALRR